MRLYLLLSLTLAILLQLAAARLTPVQDVQHHRSTTVANGPPPPPRTTTATSSG